MKASKEERLEIESASEWERAIDKIAKMIEDHPGWNLKITVILRQSVSVPSEEESVKKFNNSQLQMFDQPQV